MTNSNNIYLKLLLLGGLMMSSGSPCLAAEPQTLGVSYRQSVVLEISATGTNRINFGRQRITKLIGDTNLITSVLSADGKNLFLTTKLGAAPLATTGQLSASKPGQEEASHVSVSAITASGEVVDFNLKIVNSPEPKFIELDFSNYGHNILGNTELERQLAAKQMIVDIINNNASKYYVTIAAGATKTKSRSLEFNNGQLIGEIMQAYRYGDLTGYELQLTSHSKEWQMLDTEAIKQVVPSLKAIKLARRSLLPNKTTKMWLVINNRELGE